MDPMKHHATRHFSYTKLYLHYPWYFRQTLSVCFEAILAYINHVDDTREK